MKLLSNISCSMTFKYGHVTPYVYYITKAEYVVCKVSYNEFECIPQYNGVMYQVLCHIVWCTNHSSQKESHNVLLL